MTRHFLFCSIIAMLALAWPANNAHAAHCFCQLTCGSKILNKFTDPNRTYTQFGNVRNRQCKDYCTGWLDGQSQADLKPYCQQCADGNCNATLTMSDAVGTQGYRFSKSRTITGTKQCTCPSGQHLGNNQYCGTLMVAFTGSSWAFVPGNPNRFVDGTGLYVVDGPASCTCNF
jgi:hypothetical protein